MKKETNHKCFVEFFEISFLWRTLGRMRRKVFVCTSACRDICASLVSYVGIRTSSKLIVLGSIVRSREITGSLMMDLRVLVGHAMHGVHHWGLLLKWVQGARRVVNLLVFRNTITCHKKLQ